MSLPASSLRAFLTSAKRNLQTAIAKQEQVNLVIGNESADLDSITSSIVFAYLRSQSQPRPSSPYVPVVNVPRADIRIRAELLQLLPYANIEPDQLITLDDLPTSHESRVRLQPENTRWVLVDHNALQGPLGEAYAHRVFGCIDHHVEENKVPKDTDGEPRVIKPTGSCTSLVVNHFRDTWERLSQSSSESATAQGQGDVAPGTDNAAVRRTWDSQIAKLALASILIDTSDLKAKDKVTEDDERAVQYLQAKVEIAPKSGGNFNRRDFYKEINKAKKNIEGMSLNDLLRKDYKQWTEKEIKIGISSVVQSLSYMLSLVDGSENINDAFFGELKSFAHERDLGMLVVMTKSTSSSGTFQKEIFLWEINDSAKSVGETFEKSGQTELGLEEWKEQPLTTGTESSIKVWWQRNTNKSRKQVAPMLREAANA